MNKILDKNKKTNLLLSVVLIAGLYLLLFVLEQIIPVATFCSWC